MPNHEPVFPAITESDFGRLTDEQQAQELLRRQKERDARHKEILEGQVAIRDQQAELIAGAEKVDERLDYHGRAIRDNVDATNLLRGRVDSVAVQLDANTVLTKAVALDTKAVKDNTQELVQGFEDIKTTYRIIDKVVRFGIRVAVPVIVAIFGAAMAFMAWVLPWLRSIVP